MNQKINPGEARRRRLLREVSKDTSSPATGLTEVAAFLAIVLVAVVAVSEARTATIEANAVSFAPHETP